MLLADGVTVARGRTVLLRDLRLVVGAGELVHVAGPNGCGKSSLLRVLAGVVEPRRGRVERAAPCAFVPERLALPAGLRASRWLQVAGARGAELPTELDRPCGALSKGQLQRVAIAGALHAAGERPAILVLDEPWAGLDGEARGALGAALGDAAVRGSAVVFTDHSGAATVRATRALTLAGAAARSGTPPAPGGPGARSSRVRIALARGAERAEVIVDDAELAERLARGWTVRDAEPLP